MSAVKDRVRLHRQRQAAGRAILPLDVDEVRVADFLIRARLLDPVNADDRMALTKATERLLELIIIEDLP